MAFSPGWVPRPLLIPLPVLTVVIPLSKIPLPFAQMILYGDRTSIVPSIWYTCSSVLYCVAEKSMIQSGSLPLCPFAPKVQAIINFHTVRFGYQ